MDEIWKSIPSAPNYEVSDRGRVRRAMPGKRTSIGKVLRPQMILGYWTVWLTHNAQQVRHRINRLVCEAFHGPPPLGKPLALHTDGDRANNVPDNLRWGDYLDNGQDLLRHGRAAIGERARAAKLTGKEVIAIRAAYDAGADRQSLAKQFNVHPFNVHLIVSRKSWKHL